VDAHVGRLVSDRRRALAMSRSQLAQALGISQEQVRRYEAGQATIVASRLYAIGQILGVPVNHFFEGIASASPRPRPAAGGPRDPELRRVVEAFWAIGDNDSRRALLTLIEAIAESDGPLGPSPTRLS
jgi:transcriptional regulator with XRE-family HTH domain